MIWILVIGLYVLEAVHWIIVQDRMEQIERMNSITLREMWNLMEEWKT